MSCIERCFHFSGNFLLRKHIWDTTKPLNAGVALRELLGRPDNEKVEQTVHCTTDMQKGIRLSINILALI